MIKFQQFSSTAVDFTTVIINQHIWMITDRPCYTEDWSDDAENTAYSNKK